MAIRMGMSTITIHAPDVNLVAAEIISTTNVVTAPSRLTAKLRCQPGDFCRHHRKTMPICDSVNELNTPIVYNGISAVTLPLKETIRMQASVASVTMPHENASRSPLNEYW